MSRLSLIIEGDFKTKDVEYSSPNRSVRLRSLISLELSRLSYFGIKSMKTLHLRKDVC